MEDHPHIIVSRPADSYLNDCACPDHGQLPLSVPQSHSRHTRWHIAPALFRAALRDGYEVAFNPFATSNVVALNRAAVALLNRFAEPYTLADVAQTGELDAATIEQMIQLRLIVPEGEVNAPLHTQPHTLTAWLHVTNACNLRCHYCYIDKTEEAMAEDTGLAAVDAVFRSAQMHGFQTVKLKYAGGESTLNFDLVKQLHERALCRATETGLGLREVVLSNGVALSIPMLEFIHQAHLSLMISLDGVGEVHDAQRVFRNGKGSFKQVARGIDRALACGVMPHLSITVTGRSAAQLPAVVNYALDRNLKFNLNFYRDTDCAISRTDLAHDHQQLIAGMQAAFKVIEMRMPQDRLIDGLVDHAMFDQPHEHACGAGHNYMVIDQRGSVAHCQMEIERSITSVMSQDPLQAIRQPNAHFSNPRASQKQGCRDCAWQRWCAGGCPLLTLKATGRTDVQSPLCDVFKALYPEAIKLEGMRLVQHECKVPQPE
jgi:uncharacterized protein